MGALLQFFENIIVRLIDKMNILFVLLLLLLFGVMNKEEVFEWIVVDAFFAVSFSRICQRPRYTSMRGSRRNRSARAASTSSPLHGHRTETATPSL